MPTDEQMEIACETFMAKAGSGFYVAMTATVEVILNMRDDSLGHRRQYFSMTIPKGCTSGTVTIAKVDPNRTKVYSKSEWLESLELGNATTVEMFRKDSSQDLFVEGYVVQFPAEPTQEKE